MQCEGSENLAGLTSGPGSRMFSAMPKFLTLLACGCLLAASAAGESLSVSGRARVQTPEIVLFQRNALQSPGDRLRVATWNLQDFSDGSRDGRLRTRERVLRQARNAAAMIEEIDPDVLVLEEIENARSLSLLNSALRRPFPVACIARFEAGLGNEQKHNVAVLSRVMLLGLREIDAGYLKGAGRPPRGILSFAVDLGDQRRLLIYGVHLKSNYGEAARNMARRYNLLSLLAGDARFVRTSYPKYRWEMLVLGDMNTDPEDSQFADDRTLEPLNGWADLWRGRPLAERVTLPRRLGDPAQNFPSVTFDRIFASPELQEPPWTSTPPRVLQRGVDTNNVFALAGENDLHVSDHYPVWVDVVK